MMDNDVMSKRFPFLPWILVGLINSNVYMLFRNKNKHLSEIMEWDMHYTNVHINSDNAYLLLANVCS